MWVLPLSRHPLAAVWPRGPQTTRIVGAMMLDDREKNKRRRIIDLARVETIRRIQRRAMALKDVGQLMMSMNRQMQKLMSEQTMLRNHQRATIEHIEQQMLVTNQQITALNEQMAITLTRMTQQFEAMYDPRMMAYVPIPDGAELRKFVFDHVDGDHVPPPEDVDERLREVRNHEDALRDFIENNAWLFQ